MLFDEAAIFLGGRNQTKTLLGIETFRKSPLVFVITSRNQTKTLLGIETRRSFTGWVCVCVPQSN